jgi:hypothetical protein
VSLHFTLGNNAPAGGLKLDHIGPNGAAGDFHTSLPTPDVVFSYTGTIDAGDKLEYTLDFTGDATSTWTAIDGPMIDTAAKTITFHNFDLSAADAYITIRGTNLAGANAHYQQSLDGPYTSYFSQYSASNAKFILSGQFATNVYLTDGSNAPVKLATADASGGLVGGEWVAIGAQSTAMQGALGAGNDALVQTIKDKGTYGFGTGDGDALSGNYVWGFGGDDTITATGSEAYNSSYISGGAGADGIHTESSSSQIMYAGSQESFLAADDAVAHGFDTVYLSNGVPTSFTDVLNFEDIKLGDFYKPVGAANFSGSETGNALLAALETAVSGSFKAEQALSQAALINFGSDSDGRAVNFLVIDADKDGHVGSGDYVVKIVGAIGSSSVSFDHGMVFFNTLSV